MSTRPLIVGKIELQGPTERSLMPHQNVVQALASDGAHQPLRKGILPARNVPTVEFDRKKFEKVSQSISTAVGTLRIPVCSSPWPIPKRSLRILPSELATETSRPRSEEHTSELQSQSNLVCRLLLEKKMIQMLQA